MDDYQWHYQLSDIFNEWSNRKNVETIFLWRIKHKRTIKCNIISSTWTNGVKAKEFSRWEFREAQQCKSIISWIKKQQQQQTHQPPRKKQNKNKRKRKTKTTKNHHNPPTHPLLSTKPSAESIHSSHHPVIFLLIPKCSLAVPHLHQSHHLKGLAHSLHELPWGLNSCNDPELKFLCSERGNPRNSSTSWKSLPVAHEILYPKVGKNSQRSEDFA